MAAETSNEIILRRGLEPENLTTSSAETSKESIESSNENNDEEDDEDEEKLTINEPNYDLVNDKNNRHESSKSSHSRKEEKSERHKKRKRSESESEESEDEEHQKHSKSHRKRDHESDEYNKEEKRSRKSSKEDSKKREREKKHKSSKREHANSDEESDKGREKRHKSSRREHADSDEENYKGREKKHKSSKREHVSSDEENGRETTKKHKSSKTDAEKSSISSSISSSKYKEDKRKSKSADKENEELKRREEKLSSSSHKKDKKQREETKERSSDKSKKLDEPGSSKSEHKNSSKHKSSKCSKEEKPTKLPAEKVINEIDSCSGASFAEALGMCAPVKKSSSASTSSKKHKSSSSKNGASTSTYHPSSSREKPDHFKAEIPKLLAEPYEPVDLNISSLLPSITPNYRPLGNAVTLDTPFKKTLTDYEALTHVISTKNQRTKVYSGNKVSNGIVPSLFEFCVRVLQENLDALEYTGGVPYSILKPILDKASPDQLYMMEHHNPYLIEDTDELWQLHCNKEFRLQKREEMETWRDMYMRCLDEREAKLKALTANIKQSQDKSQPVRQTKLAYVDGFVKPPRNIIRKQAKNGTVFDKKPSQTPSSRLNALALGGESVPNPGSRASTMRSSSSSSAIKPKKAPLMAKTLSFMKNRFKR